MWLIICMRRVYLYIFLTYLVHCSVAYQRYRIDSVESANSVLQVMTREPTQKIADGANTVHNHINIHSRLQTRREISASQLSHYYIYLCTIIIHDCKLKTKCMRDLSLPTLDLSNSVTSLL